VGIRGDSVLVPWRPFFWIDAEVVVQGPAPLWLAAYVVWLVLPPQPLRCAAAAAAGWPGEALCAPPLCRLAQPARYHAAALTARRPRAARALMGHVPLGSQPSRCQPAAAARVVDASRVVQLFLVYEAR
jgi:hypothetical protein